MIATKYDKRGLVTDTKRFYTQDDFDKAEEDLVKAGYDCQYKKGLAACHKGISSSADANTGNSETAYKGSSGS